VDGERGNVGGADDAADRERRAQLFPALLGWSPSSEADNGVSTKPAGMRLTRTGAISSARAATNVSFSSTMSDPLPMK